MAINTNFCRHERFWISVVVDGWRRAIATASAAAAALPLLPAVFRDGRRAMAVGRRLRGRTFVVATPARRRQPQDAAIDGDAAQFGLVMTIMAVDCNVA